MQTRAEQFARTFLHPESDEEIELYRALSYYAWHCRHHTGQILWLRREHGWDDRATRKVS
jgi:hypothetical protein